MGLVKEPVEASGTTGSTCDRKAMLHLTQYVEGILGSPGFRMHPDADEVRNLITKLASEFEDFIAHAAPTS